jgi:hypothetical protein
VQEGRQGSAVAAGGRRDSARGGRRATRRARSGTRPRWLARAEHQTSIEAQTGSPVRSQYRSPGEPRSRPSDAIIVAPATYKTINKWARGISDTYALGVLAETTGLGLPIVALPFVNSALAARAPFQDSVQNLRGEGVRILLGPGGVEPHEPHTGGELIASFPWRLALDETERLTGP